MRWKAKKYLHKEGDKEVVIKFAWCPEEGPDGTVYWLERVRIQRTWEWCGDCWYAQDVVIGPVERE